MSIETRIKLKEGLLWIDEKSTHERGNHIIYGRCKLSGTNYYHYTLLLSDLKKLENFRFPWIFRDVDGHNYARITLSSGLQLVRKKEYAKKTRNITKKATFSKEEYEIIRQYL
ncbi:MAG: hypothetical protein V1645_04375 [archaeon]